MTTRLSVQAMLLAVLFVGACGDTPSGTLDAGVDADEVDASEAGIDAGPARCDDGLANGSESDVDCGGRCAPCALHAACIADRDCASEACASGECVAPSCTDGRRDGFESDVDCGGLHCARCGTGLRCTAASHCASAVCTSGVCIAAGCEDGVRNADESDVDCGGGCDGCLPLERCDGASDCESSVCVLEACVASSCDDDVRNGSETGEDCGGTCPDDCGAGEGCSGPADCVSAVCTASMCVAASCDDDVQNDDETDVDCGGSCDPCGHLETCLVAGDCLSNLCHDLACVIGPTAALVLDVTAGEAPLLVRASSAATAGDAAITNTEYDFGDGYGSTTSRTFHMAGSYVVRQRVTDAFGYTSVSMRGVEVAPSTFPGTYLSETDNAGELTILDDRLSLTIESVGNRGVRSTQSIAPGQGVYYFEASIPERFALMTVGIATASANLTERAGENAQSFGLDTGGQFYFGGGYLSGFDASNLTYGFVVDYRGASPIVHVIMNSSGGEPTIVRTQDLMSITAPVFIYASGMRRTTETQLRINAGNDTTNFPFVFDPVEVLTDANLPIANDVVLGFAGTRALPLQSAPVLSAPSGLTVAEGTPVMLTATATDAEDGSLTPFIRWEDLATGHGPSRLVAMGGSFAFTPTVMGIHPIRVSVMDAGGKVDAEVIDVVVTGTLPALANVHLEADATSGAGITLSPDGYAAHYSIDAKNGIRVNQGIFGGFWYFEAERLVPVTDQGVGLVTKDGDLDPYTFNITPPSCSLNVVGATWQNLIFHRGVVTTETHFGFAVDYRGRYPIVYIIVDGAVIDEIHMRDATVPVYPMLYGNVTNQAGPFDMGLNLGQTAFHYDARAALTAYGLPDAASLELCWGSQNAACP